MVRGKISWMLSVGELSTDGMLFTGRNDFDILEVGNGDMTFEENKSHFTGTFPSFDLTHFE